MHLNSLTLKKVFLPLTFLFVAVCAGKAHAEDPNTVDATTAFSNPVARTTETFKLAQTRLPSQVALAPEQTRAAETPLRRGSVSKAAALGQPSIEVTKPQAETASSIFTVAQSSPSTDTPGRALPGNTPSGTPTNPADVTPSNTTPGTTTTPSTTPGTTTTPSTTPDTTPVSPQNTTPTTPGTTTPDTTTPGTTTPDTTTPGTTTPDTTQPLTTPQVTPGRSTRSGSSYVGIGGNFGIGSNDSGLGDTSFAVISKIGLTRDFSVRPSVLFGDNVSILLPVTYDFTFGAGPTDELGFTAAPFLGVGAAISTGDGGDVSLLLTGGLDVPISSQFTATASVNASVTGETAVGVMVGIGYNFAGF